MKHKFVEFENIDDGIICHTHQLNVETSITEIC